MTRSGLIVLFAVLVAQEARASCQAPSSCFCSQLAERFGVVVTESIDGAKATVRVEQVGTGLTAGSTLTVARGNEETVGSKWVLVDTRRFPVNDAGEVRCINWGPSGPMAPVDTVMAALGSSDQCHSKLAEAGLAGGSCNDVGRACSVSLGSAHPMLAALWFGLGAWRRRRRAPTTV